MTATRRKLGINQAQIEIGGRARVEHLGTAPDSRRRRVRAPLGSHGVAEFSVPSGCTAQPAARIRVMGSGDAAVGRSAGELAKHG